MFPGPEGACAFLGVRDGEELPIPLESSQPAGSQVNEGDVRAGHEVTHGSGHHDLRRLRLAYDARGDVHADPGHVPSLQIDLTGVHSRADVETHAAELGAKRMGETDRLLRGLEHRELPSPRCFTTRPRNRLASSSARRSCPPRSSLQRRSPSSCARSVEPTMSVNITVRTARPNRQLTGRGASISTTGLWAQT